MAKDWTKQRERQRERKQFVRDFLVGKVCVDCGCPDIRVLQYHHIDPTKKLFAVSQPGTRSIKTIEEEIAKTVLLCPTCHVIRHLEDRGSGLRLHHERRRKERESQAGR